MSEISLGILASLNALDRQRDRLIEIAEDGQITEDELPDFARIQDRLNKISLTVESLKLWMKNTAANGNFDREKFTALLEDLHQ